ncbi:MAG: hypothetical protein AAGF78_04135 [Pseudomonadota bacterium]
MFQNWGFLLGEIWLLIALAALLGLFVGWLIWAKSPAPRAGGDDASQLRADLERCRSMHSDKDDRIRALEAEIGSLRLVAAKTIPPRPMDTTGDDRDDTGDGQEDGVKPATLSAARAGMPDDLKRIKGVGRKLEGLCFQLGFYHFDQIASWTDEEVAWVDANLEGFKGRVSRDDWVSQAKVLAAGGETAFSRKVDDGDVY